MKAPRAIAMTITAITMSDMPPPPLVVVAGGTVGLYPPPPELLLEEPPLVPVDADVGAAVTDAEVTSNVVDATCPSPPFAVTLYVPGVIGGIRKGALS